jgi:perosamine synthetase
LVLYGPPADMPAIRAIAEKFELHLIKDAAQSLGGKYSGKMSGSAVDVAAFSFHRTKTLTTDEGGIATTDVVNKEVAYKHKMSDPQAAFGLAQLERIDQLLEKERRIFSMVQDAISRRYGNGTERGAARFHK